LLAAPLIVQQQTLSVGGWIVAAVLLAAIVWGILTSKKPVAEVK